MTLAVFARRSAKRKTPKGGQSERARREEHGASAGLVKNFQNAGDVANNTAGM
jgi:hypothetical protein